MLLALFDGDEGYPIKKLSCRIERISDSGRDRIRLCSAQQRIVDCRPRHAV